MPKLYSSKEIATILVFYNFEFYSQKGSHGKYKNLQGATVIVPMNKKEIPEGTLRGICKQANISVAEFKRKLNEM